MMALVAQGKLKVRSLRPRGCECCRIPVHAHVFKFQVSCGRSIFKCQVSSFKFQCRSTCISFTDAVPPGYVMVHSPLCRYTSVACTHSQTTSMRSMI